MLLRTAILLWFAFIMLSGNGQTLLAAIDSNKLVEPYLKQAEKKAIYLNEHIEKKTLHLILTIQKQEAKLRKKLYKKDSLAAIALFPKDQALYSQLTKQITNPKAQTLQEYIPGFDSLKTSLAFLNNPGSAIQQKLPPQLKEKLTSVTTQITSLQSRMQAAEEIRQQIKQRRAVLQQQLANYGLAKNLKKFNKEVYYYQQQLSEYKSLLKDRKKAEAKMLAALRKLPAFQTFMKEHSQLASLFRVPDNYGTPQSLAGLQSRASVQNELLQRFGGTGVNPQQYIGQQVQQAQGELNKLKDKVSKFGGGSSDDLTPALSKGEGGFEPNTQKTKRLLNRFEFGANVQSQKNRGLLPVTSDVALTAGYKLSDKSIIGIGAAYKLGWGTGWQHIKLSSEGIGLRSFIDWKIPSPFGGSRKGAGSFWLTGGYEQNYQSSLRGLTFSSSFGGGREGAAWQTSGLLGLTKKYKIGKKTNNLQLLWDFLSYQQVPGRQAVVFRVGVRF